MKLSTQMNGNWAWVANRTWVFYEESPGGLSHGEERWVLPSKSTTYYKLIKLLEIVPDSGEIVRETDIWHIYYLFVQRSQGWNPKQSLALRRSGDKYIRERRKQRGGTGAIRGDANNIKPEGDGLHRGRANGNSTVLFRQGHPTRNTASVFFTCALWPPNAD